MANSEIKSDKPRFSIIMPLYNKGEYVERAIQSVISQSFENWELIVVNDGSTDNSFNVASKVIEKYSRCRIINQANAGVGAARNNGVAESIADYLCFLDADDWWDENFLYSMNAFVGEFPDAALYASNYIYYKPGRTRVGVNHPTGYINYPKLYFKNGDMPVWTGTVCMPRRIFEKYGGFPIDIRLGEDFLLWSKIAVENKVAFLNKPLAYYNNEIPASQRATRHLYNPQHHMLFNMGWLENKVSTIEDGSDWNNLMDMLREKGLLEYWLSKEYHQNAAEELKKVDWSMQPKSVILRYKTPRWLLTIFVYFMRVGSKIKQRIINL